MENIFLNVTKLRKNVPFYLPCMSIESNYFIITFLWEQSMGNKVFFIEASL